MHARRQIINSVYNVLTATSHVEWKHVYKSRLAPQRDVLPFLLIHIDDERDSEMTFTPSPVVLRDMILSIAANVRISNDYEEFEAALDASAAEIESVLTFDAVDTDLGGYLKNLNLQGSISEIIEDEMDRTYARITLTYNVQVVTTMGDSETLIN